MSWMHMEWLAVRGAANDPRPDKSDWIRIWATARIAQGKAAESTDWRGACIMHEELPENTRLIHELAQEEGGP